MKTQELKSLVADGVKKEAAQQLVEFLINDSRENVFQAQWFPWVNTRWPRVYFHFGNKNVFTLVQLMGVKTYATSDEKAGRKKSRNKSGEPDIMGGIEWKIYFRKLWNTVAILGGMKNPILQFINYKSGFAWKFTTMFVLSGFLLPIDIFIPFAFKKNPLITLLFQELKFCNCKLFIHFTKS